MTVIETVIKTVIETISPKSRVAFMARGSARGLATALLVAVGVLLAACVTETESVFTEKASPKKVVEQRVTLARQYIGQGNWEDAKRNLRVAEALDDSNAGVFEALALVYQNTGEYEMAEESFRRAISLQSNFSRARNNFASFLYAQERYPEAEEQLEIVVLDTLYQARPLAFVNLGLCRLQLSKPREAEEAFTRALAMQRDNTIALLELAQLRLDAGDSANASYYYDEYRNRVRQPNARALWLGVRVARETGNTDAESSYALALRNLYPDSAEYGAYVRSLKNGV